MFTLMKLQNFNINGRFKFGEESSNFNATKKAFNLNITYLVEISKIVIWLL
jgi:hypothetical protein